MRKVLEESTFRFTYATFDLSSFSLDTQTTSPLRSMPPPCCSCCSIGKCTRCVCIRNGRRCTNCQPIRHGRCENSSLSGELARNSRTSADEEKLPSSSQPVIMAPTASLHPQRSESSLFPDGVSTSCPPAVDTRPVESPPTTRSEKNQTGNLKSLSELPSPRSSLPLPLDAGALLLRRHLCPRSRALKIALARRKPSQPALALEIQPQR